MFCGRQASARTFCSTHTHAALMLTEYNKIDNLMQRIFMWQRNSQIKNKRHVQQAKACGAAHEMPLRFIPTARCTFETIINQQQYTVVNKILGKQKFGK